jgi:lysophospholipase L1-like esterase
LDADSFVFYLRGSGSYAGIEVDGADDGSRIYTPPDGSYHFYTVNFVSRARRQIALKLGGNYQFGGVYISPTSGMWPGVLPKQHRMIVVGDSFSEDSASTGWTSGLMSLFQNLDVWASAVGSTGYVNPGTDGRTNFQARIFPDVITNSPEFVLFAGGLNDNQGTTNAATSNTLYSVCLNLYQTVQSSLPNCKIVVLGPFWPRTPPGQSTDKIFTVNAAISNACVAAGIGANYIDTLSDPWVTGVWNQPGSGNAVIYTSGDGTHPTQAGHWNIAYHVASELAKRFPELQPRSGRR